VLDSINILAIKLIKWMAGVGSLNFIVGGDQEIKRYDLISNCNN
jgi:hypothetical protein